MYQPAVNVCLIGKSDELKQQIESIQEEGGIDCVVECGEELDPAVATEAEILIFHGPSDFVAARRLVRPGTLLVACLTANEESSLSPEERDQLDDIWRAPLAAARLHKRLTRLFEEIKGRDYSSFLLGCLDTLINSMPDLVWFKDLDGIHTKVNDYFCEFVDKPREQVESSTHEAIWGVSEAAEGYDCNATDRAALDSGETVVAEEVVQTGTEKRMFRTIKTPIYDPKGAVLGTVGIAHDITNRLNLNMELDLFIEMMPFPLMICNLEDQIVKANPQFLEFFGIGLEELTSLNWRDWYEDNIRHEISPTGEQIYRHFTHADNHVSFLKMISHEMDDLFGNYMGAIHVFEDVTADKEQEYNIWRLANTDALTGLANRHAFYEYARRINPNEHISLFYVDLDNFKQVNDVYGHKAGDEALKVTASILRHVFFRDFPARLGGDEFVICVRRDVSLEELEEMARELIQQMQESFSGKEIFTNLSCSVGICFNASMEEGIEAVMKKTDSAMYEAKKQGKACYRIYNESDE